MNVIRSGAATGLIVGAIVHTQAGSLDPPGPPAPTPGFDPRIAINSENTPGDDSAFFRITESGSYYLTRNIENPLLQSTRHGIVIEASDVTIDLNGFTLDGYEPFVLPLAVDPEPRGLGVMTSGILASGEREGITIRNGIVRDWPRRGLDLSNDGSCLIDSVTVSDNGAEGMWTGNTSVVTRCTAEGNGETGIQVGSGTTVTDCAASSNGENGIGAGVGSTISDCSVFQNLDDGIQTANGCTVSNSTAYGNGAMGFRVTSFSTVRGCTATNNTGSGIFLPGGRCLVIGNTCSNNGDGDDAGIESGALSSSFGNRIEGNTVSSNDNIGIDVDLAGNLIIRNSASGNAVDYSIVGGNDVGTIQTSPVGAGAWDNFDL